MFKLSFSLDLVVQNRKGRDEIHFLFTLVHEFAMHVFGFNFITNKKMAGRRYDLFSAFQAH